MTLFRFLRRGPGRECVSRLRTICAFAAGLLLGFSVSHGADLDEIRTRQVLRVALPAQDAPPFVVTQPDGRVGGLEGDLVADLAHRMNVRVELIRTARSGDELVAQLRDNRADLALGQLADSLERAKSVRFTMPYLTLYQARLFDRLAAARAGGIAALLEGAEARLAVRAEGVAWSLLHEGVEGPRLVVLPDLPSAVAEAEAGRVAAVIGDDVEMARWLAAHPEAGIRWEVELQRDRPLTVAMAVHWQAENLQAWLNLYLGKCSRDQTLSKLWTKYLGEARMRMVK